MNIGFGRNSDFKAHSTEFFCKPYIGMESIVKDDRKRQPVKSDYVEALGLATYCFATCEWNAVWCCEKIRSGSLSKILCNKMTAGAIAKTFIDLSRNMPRSKERNELNKSAKEFERLVIMRNDILHGKPCTGPNGEPRLSGTKAIEIGDLEDAADAFTACGIELNAHLYGFLGTNTTP